MWISQRHVITKSYTVLEFWQVSLFIGFGYNVVQQEYYKLSTCAVVLQVYTLNYLYGFIFDDCLQKACIYETILKVLTSFVFINTYTFRLFHIFLIDKDS